MLYTGTAFHYFQALDRRDQDAREILQAARRPASVRPGWRLARCPGGARARRRRRLRRPSICASPASSRSRSALPRSRAPFPAASPSRRASASRTRRCCMPLPQSGAGIDVFTLDTGRHFPETLETLAGERAALRPAHPRRSSPDAREVEELVGPRRHLRLPRRGREPQGLLRDPQGAPVEASASRRGRLGHGTAARSVGRAGRWCRLPHGTPSTQLVKINPIADWSLEQLEAYVAEHDVPVNPLHARGYPSIGCQPCTRAIKPGEDIRAGRWWWENEDGKECGLHNRPRHKEAAA